MAISRFHNNDYTQDKRVVRSYLQWMMIAAGLILLFILPSFLVPNHLMLANQIGIAVIAALGIHILTSKCGIINLGQAGFMAVGAFTTAILCYKAGFSFWVALPLSVLVCGVMGIIFGLPSLRVKGFYLVIVTLAAGIILPLLIDTQVLGPLNLEVHMGVPMPPPTLGGVSFDSQGKVFYIIMPLMLLITFITLNLERGRLGRTLGAVRDNDMASEVIGVNNSWYRLVAFFICCLFAGVGGSLWAIYMPSVSTSQFPFIESVWYLGIVVVGGMGSIAGVFLGSIIIRGVSFLVSTSLIPHLTELAFTGVVPQDMIMRAMGINPLVISAIVILFFMFASGGVIRWWQRFKTFQELWPVSF